MPPNPLLLLDGDILCYQAAWHAQETVDWEDGEEPQVFANMRRAKAHLDKNISEILRIFPLAELLVCFSDPNKNFRKELWPEYKAHRDPQARPLLLCNCREELCNDWPWRMTHGLEADDVMGIEATSNAQAVMVSIDKDMLTVPGKLFNPGKPDRGVREITPADAYLNHMRQTLIGDSTDGYKGCPGIGPKRAEAILANAASNPNTHFDDWRKELWNNVLASYCGKGLAAANAILNARLAKILTREEWNLETQRVMPWNPPG